MEIQIHGNGHKPLQAAELMQEIQRLDGELTQERVRSLRTLEDFSNYRRRIERDGDKIAGESKREMMLPLLDIIDDLEKALPLTGTQDRPSVKGVKFIYRKFLELLKNQGIVSFQCAGTTFDHTRHEAVAIVKQEGAEAGTVIEEVRRGYLWNNELLRPAQVLVAG